MDLFKKNKIISLLEIIDEKDEKILKLMDEKQELHMEINFFKTENIALKTSNAGFEELRKQNEKLIKWIEQIIDASNILELKDGDEYKALTLPIFKETLTKYDEYKPTEPLKERITIPEIHFVRCRFGG
jgi:hypothetical protein